MSLLSAIFLGIVQGITEFIPVSSSGHLSVIQNIFHISGSDFTYDVMLHLGTLLAILLTYGRDLRAVRGGFAGMLGRGRDAGSKSTRAAERRRRSLLMLLAILPMLPACALVGAMERFSTYTVLIGFMMLLNGLVLFAADRRGYARKTEQQITVTDMLIVGLAQLFSVIPGISSAGMTISAGTVRGFQKSFAVRFSYLMSVPVVLAAVFVSLIHALHTGIDFSLMPYYLVGMLVSAIVGTLSIRLVSYLASRGNLGGFAYYCWGAGIITLLLSLVS